MRVLKSFASLLARMEELTRKFFHRERLVHHRAANAPTRSEMPSMRLDAERPPQHADERTIRRVAESQLGGLSTEESRHAYLSGKNPGGIHHGGKRDPDLE